ncbi:restriction endonuclease subunit S [Marinifilum fragile]|uniref:restriction endonuclease subunit S n=1 Tax=Marinifilum fragile TaxID=570161 RepID=UPI002AA88D95|nr:restriction endonuclease subunit S [Marinifilum fragile]
MKLLEHFKELSIYPQNAKELKGLILQLAIQGKLTQAFRESHPELVEGSHSAKTLLEQIQAEKAQLIKDKKIKKEKVLPPISKEEIPFGLPDSWEWCRLIEVGQIIGGGTPRANNPEYFQENGIPWLTPADLGSYKDKFISKGRRDISELGLAKSSAKLMPKGTVLFTSRAPIGHIAIAANSIATNQGFKSCVPFIMDMNEFIYIHLKASVKRINDNATGTTFKEVSGKEVGKILIPLPPLAEQKAIVQIVDTLFKEVEALEELTQKRVQLKEDFISSALRRLSEGEVEKEWAFLQQHFSTFMTEESNVKKLRECILQLAVQGKLTRAFRESHPELVEGSNSAKTLLQQIQAEKAQLIKDKKIKKEKALPPITQEEKPYDLPEGWEWCRFQEIFDIRDGTHDSPKDSSNAKTYPLVTSKNFKNNKIDFDSARRISEEDYLKVIQRSQVHKGDVLFSMIGGNIGNQVEVGDFTEFAIKNVALFKHYKFGLPADGFLKLFSKYLAMDLQSRAAGGAQPFVSLKLFRNVVLGLPSLNEQQAIVTKVNELMALCDTLEQEIAKNKEAATKLMQSVLREVFQGKPDSVARPVSLNRPEELAIAAEPKAEYK